MSDLQIYCVDLTSTQMKKRNNSYTQLLQLITDEDVQNSLNRGSEVTWEALFLAANQYIHIESQKCFTKDSKGNGGASKKTKCSLLLNVVQLGNKAEINIPISKLVDAISNSLAVSNIRFYYTDTYLHLLQNYILAEKYFGNMPTNNWLDLLNVLKLLYRDDQCRSSLSALLNCLLLMVKCASVVNLPIHLLRNSCLFISDISRQLHTDSPRLEWEMYLQLLIEYCKLNMYDYRKSTCKFGEDTYYLTFNFNNLQLKIYLYKFYLLQMELHHPHGVDNNNETFCCNSWTEWQNVLQALYGMIQKELNNYQCNISYHNKECEDDLAVTFRKLFIKLTVELYKQFNSKTLFTKEEESLSLDEEHVAKKRKIETIISEMISQIESNWNCLSITIVAELLKKYPSLITAEEYINILRVITKYKAELNDKRTTMAICDCLNALFDAEMYLYTNSSNLVCKHYWKTILETNLKVLILYDNRLLENLLRKYRRDDYYTKKLDNAYVSFRKHLLNLIVDGLCEDSCIDPLTAEILIGSTCLLWPKSHLVINEDKDSRELRASKNVYELNSLKTIIESQGLIVDERHENTIDEDLFNELLRLMEEFVSKRGKEFNSVSVIILLANLVSGFSNINIVEFDEFPLVTLMQNAFNCDWTNKNVLTLLPRLFSLKLHPSVFNHIRYLFDTDCIMNLFQILASKPKDDLTLNTLSLYCSCITEMTKNQVDILDAILNREQDYKMDDDCKIILDFANIFDICVPFSIPEEIFVDFVRVLHEICSMRHQEPNVTLEILTVLKFACKHAVAVKSDIHLKSFCNDLLFNLYNMREQHGPKQSKKIIECFYELLMTDPKEEKIKSFDLLPKLITYLSNPYQMIRLMAVEAVVSVFNLLTYDRQKDVMEIVHLQLKSSSERAHVLANDEESLFAVTIFNFYAGIINENTLWKPEALYYLLDITKWKCVDESNLQTLLDTLSQKIGVESGYNLVLFNIDYLFEMWFDNNNNSLEDFPRYLLKCDEYVDLCKNFKRNVVRLLARSNKELKYFTKTISTNPDDLIQELFVKFAFMELSSRDSQYFPNLFDDKQRILDNCVDIVLEIFANVYDEDHFYKQFETLTRLSPNYTRKMYDQSHCMQMIEELQSVLNESSSIIRFLLDKHPDVLQRILLQLLRNIYDKKSNREMKEIQFYRYTIFVDYLLCDLNRNDTTYVYFKRSILTTLMHTIKRYHSRNLTNLKLCKVNDALDVMACKYLKKVHSLLLTDGMDELLLTIINELVSISAGTTELSRISLDILEILFVRNVSRFDNIAHLLDPFPDGAKYANLISIYNNIKYKNGPFNLETEIRNFIEMSKLLESVDSREEGLKHLRKILCECTDEVNELYKKLDVIKHDLIHHEESIIHQLIRVLIKYANSENFTITSEASSCLGALGPRDIKTIVLQMEKSCVVIDSKPEVFLTRKVLMHLIEYIVDKDVEVVTITSTVLYDIFKYKEAKIAIDAKLNYGNGVIVGSFLVPFNQKSSTRKSLSLIINVNKFEETLNDQDIWCPSECDVTYSDWLTNISVMLAGTFENGRSYFTSLINLLRVKLEFCEVLFPLLIYLVLVKEDSLCCDILSSQIKFFFDKHVSLLMDNDVEKYSIAKNRKAIKILLDVIIFVRTQQISSNTCCSLDLDYLKVAKAAQYCGAFCSSLYCAEIFCKEQLRDENLVQNQSILMQAKLLQDNLAEDAKSMLQNVLDEAYLQLGDIDAGQGCYVQSTLKNDELIRLYSRLERWDCAVFYRDIVNAPVNTDTFNFFKAYGLYNLPTEFKGKTGLQYEFAWRLSKWDLIETNYETFEECHYFALKAAKENRQSDFNAAILSAKNIVTESIKSTSLESCKNLYQTLTRLQILKEMEQYNKETYLDEPQQLINKWREDVHASDFVYIEPIKSQRIVLLNDRQCDNNTSRVDLTKELYDVSMDLVRTARKEKQDKIALRVLENLSLTGTYSTMEDQILFERSQLTWLHDKDFAMNTLRHLLHKCESDYKLKSAALRLYGNWLIETYSANPQVIITDYLLQSISLVQTEGHSYSAGTYDELASYADQQYQRYESYANSTEFDAKVKMMEQSRLVADNSNRKIQCTKDEKKALITHDVQSKIDQREIEAMLNEKHKYLTLAFKYYLLSLLYNDNSNIRIFRIISLWLKNKQNTELREHVGQYLKKLPTYKFIPVLPQLVPHLSNDEEDFLAKQVFDIIYKCAIEHPHHTLPLVMAIANGDKESTKDKTQSNEPRLLGSQKLLKLLKLNKSTKKTIEEMEVISESLIDFAYHYDNKYMKGNTYPLPRNLKLKTVKNFTHVLLPTITLPVDIHGNYSNVIGVHTFDNKFSMVGGINAPKRIECIGTDGITRVLLAKGEDDLRQDAVMQQVFTIMNELFATNKETRDLRVRTYKVVPLSKKSGVLEWVNNSMPIGQYLSGKKGAHEVYNPNDLVTIKCVQIMKNCSNMSKDDKLQTYLRICKQFRPVFHKFFETSYLEPTVWYERRRAYTKSVATSSMCGYILGIGDRHVENILIDKRTAEVIHIDFGIAFEQGKILPTPEMVPFRLTRDIEDGMGVFGVEGLFKKSCERSLEMLRNNSKTILSILEVLLYDPLYTWAITPAQAHNKQLSESSSSASNSTSSPIVEHNKTNTLAERALTRLRSKLDGTECISYRSSKAEVERLVQEARDPIHLSRMFFGWQAFL